MNTKIALGVLIMVFSLAMSITMIRAEPNWVVDGDSVYVDDAKAFINISPHTIMESGEVILELESRVYSGDVDIVFGFNSSNAVPKWIKRWNGDQWIDISNVFNKLQEDHFDFNTWYYTTGATVNQGILYRLKYYIYVELNSSGKYWFGIKPSGETLAEAIAADHFYYIDPWFNTSFNFKQQVWINSTASGVSFNITKNITINTASLISAGKMRGDCFDLLVVNQWENDTLDYQWEDYLNTTYGCNTSNSIIWARLPIFNTSNYSAFIYYDNSGRSIFGNSSDESTWDDDIIAAYHFDDNGTHIMNRQGNSSLNGEKVNGPTNATGIYGFGMFFNNESTQHLDTNSQLGFESGDFAISFWLNLATLTDAYSPSILGNSGIQDTSDPGWLVRINAAGSGNDTILLMQQTVSAFGCGAETPIIVGDWYHVTITYDSTADIVWIYYNGSLVNSCVSVEGPDTSANDVFIARNPTNSRPMNGTLDELIIYSKNLSADDVLRIYGFDATFGAEQLGPPELTIVSPENISYFTGNIDYNITTIGTIDTALVSIDGGANLTMDNTTESAFFNLSGTHTSLGIGLHNATFWVNNTDGDTDSDIVFFTVSVSQINIVDEITLEPYNMSLPNRTEIILFCSTLTNRTVITDNVLTNISIDCVIEEIQLLMDFGDDIGSIFRTLIPLSTDTNITFYMPNPINFTVLANQIKVTDLTGLFDPGIIRLTKIIDDSSVDIIEQRIGFAGLNTMYVIKDEKYGVEVQSLDGTVSRTLNELISVSAGVITITISGISFDLNITTFSDKVLWSANLDQVNNVIQVLYNDTLSNTINVTIDILNASDTTQLLFTQTTVGANNIAATFAGITPNQSYVVNLTIYHNDFLPGPQTQTAILSYDQRLLSDIPVSANTLAMIGLIFVTVLALLFGARYASIGAIIIAVTVAFMTFVLGIFSTDILTWPVIVVLFLIAILSKLTNRGVKV